LLFFININILGSSDKTIRIWDARNGNCLQTLSGHSNWV